MLKRTFLLLTLSILSAACVPTYSLVTPGTNSVADMQVQARSGWNQAPAIITPTSRSASQTWTQDGPLLDRLVFIPAVPDGEPLLKVGKQSAALPAFHKDMLPNELEELAESTFVKLFGEGNAAVSKDKVIAICNAIGLDDVLQGHLHYLQQFPLPAL